VASRIAQKGHLSHNESNFEDSFFVDEDAPLREGEHANDAMNANWEAEFGFLNGHRITKKEG
jgi:hypothetical protein